MASVSQDTKTHLTTLERKIDQHMHQSESSDYRMNRIEQKLDQLADAVISIARAEEKIAILMNDTKEIKAGLAESLGHIHGVELLTQSNTSDLKTLSRFFWLIATTTITIAATAIAMATGLL